MMKAIDMAWKVFPQQVNTTLTIIENWSLVVQLLCIL